MKKEKGGETEVKVNCSPFVSFFISCSGSDHGEKATDTCRKKAELIQAIVNEWNGYETRQIPLLYVFVDLKVHNVEKNSYHFDCIDQ